MLNSVYHVQWRGVADDHNDACVAGQESHFLACDHHSVIREHSVYASLMRMA